MRLRCLLGIVALLLPAVAGAEELHDRIDQAIAAKFAGQPVSPLADDAEFLRRASLDLAGVIPSAAEAKAFLDDKDPAKRAKLIDRLLAAPTYATRMTDLFHVMLMERLGDHPAWTKYLHDSFQANTPWDQMARDLLNPVTLPEAKQGAAFFFSKRLENYGQNPVDYPALTRDLGRLFLGKDFQCAQCHDHLFVEEYKQDHFQGMFAFVQNSYLADAKKPAVAEKPTLEKVKFTSVFKKTPKEIGPQVPGTEEVAIPAIKKGEEYEVKPDPKTKTPGKLKFSPLAQLAEVTPASPSFARAATNRLWFVMMGRGLVHPLDLDHAGNPPSHPELLDLLAKEFAAHKYDIKWLLRELALSQTYQRSSLLPDGVDQLPPPASFRTGLEKRLSAEQLLNSLAIAAGDKPDALASLKPKYLKAFANPPREPEEEFAPSLASALFVRNDEAVLARFTAKPGNLVDRLGQLNDAQVADELYLSILTRRPTAEEAAETQAYLKAEAARRPVALGHLAWALAASTEFCINH